MVVSPHLPPFLLAPDLPDFSDFHPALPKALYRDSF